MTTLKESALIYKGKKELTDLESISVDSEFKTGTFKDKNNKDIAYSYLEIEGWKYTVSGKIMSQIQMVLANRPTTKHIKIQKTPQGEIMVIPLD